MTNRLLEYKPNRLAGYEPNYTEPIADPNDVSIESKQTFQIARDAKLPLTAAKEINDTLISNKKTYKRPGLYKRALYSLTNKILVQPFKNIYKNSTFGEMDSIMQTMKDIEAYEKRYGVEFPSEKIPEQLVKSREKVHKRIQAMLPHLQTPPPEGALEKVIETETGLFSFVAKLWIARKIVGGVDDKVSEIAAFEAVNMSEGGQPGMGVLLGAALGITSDIPAATTLGKIGKSAAQGGVLATAAAAQGGNAEDIAVAFLLPGVLRVLGEYPNLVKGRNFEKIIAKEVESKGFTTSEAKSVANAVRDAVKVKGGNMTPKQWGAKHGRPLRKIDAKYNKTINEVSQQLLPPETAPKKFNQIESEKFGARAAAGIVGEKPSYERFNAEEYKKKIQEKIRQRQGEVEPEEPVRKQVESKEVTAKQPAERGEGEKRKLTSFGKPIKTDRGAIVDARKDVNVGDYVTGTVLDMERGVGVYHAGKVVKVLKQAVDIINPEGNKVRLTGKIGVLEGDNIDIIKELMGEQQPAAAPRPTEQANSYIEEEPEDITPEIEQIRQRNKGFARIPAVSDFQDISRKLKDNYTKLKSPDLDVISNAYGAVEKWRAETNKAGLLTDWAMKSLKEAGATPEQLKAIDDYLDNPTVYQGEYDNLPDEIKEVHKALKEDFDEMHALAKEEGILESYIENYTPHLYSDSESAIKKALYPQGGKLGTKFKFSNQRKIPTKDAARELGLHPIDDPIAKNAVYKFQLFKTLANKNLIETLKKLKREDGMPLIMGRPKKADKLKVWENEYQWVNVDALGRYMYVGETGEKPMLIKMNAKAEPEVAKMLNDAFAPWRKRSDWEKSYLWLKGRIKRVVMYNPLIHSWNIWSDTLDEVNFNPYSAYKVQKRGKELYDRKDEIVEYAVDSGLNLNMGFSVAKDIRKALGDAPVTNKFLKPLSKLEEWSDKNLWEGVVKHNQLGMFELMTEQLSRKHPNWSREKVGQTAANYINTLYGTLPHTWFTRALHETTSIALFARNWTVSNINMLTEAVTLGHKGLGTKYLSGDQQYEIGTRYIKHIIKGIFGLVAMANIGQLLSLLITNKMKKDGIIEGQEVPLHTTFQNEKGRYWFDSETGLTNNKGQKIYVINPYFRYIRDYIGWTTEPAKTMYNKLDPLLKQTAEQIFNYSKWREEQIVPKGAPTWDAIKLRAKYFIEGVTPVIQLSGRKGDVRTLPEIFIPFTGTWIRRGAPGGRFTGYIFDFRSEKGYEQNQIDKEIDEELQKKDLDAYIQKIISNERYKDSDAAFMRVLQNIAPLNYYWETMSRDEQDEFVGWLEKKGQKREDLTKALKDELNTLAERGD